MKLLLSTSLLGLLLLTACQTPSPEDIPEVGNTVTAPQLN